MHDGTSGLMAASWCCECRRIGRRKTLLLAVTLEVTCSVGCALVNNIYIFLAVRFLLGIHTTGELQAAFVIGNYLPHLSLWNLSVKNAAVVQV